MAIDDGIRAQLLAHVFEPEHCVFFLRSLAARIEASESPSLKAVESELRRALDLVQARIKPQE